MSWVGIITTVVNVAASIISDRSKAKAGEKAAYAAKSAERAALDEAKIQAAKDAGYVVSGAGYIPAYNTTKEQTELSSKAKGSRFGGDKLTASETDRLSSLINDSFNGQSKQQSVYEAKTNSMTNPILYPDAGLGSGLGSYGNPAQIPDITILPESVKNAVKTAGMSPWLMLGLVGAGAGVLYNANKKKPKRRR